MSFTKLDHDTRSLISRFKDASKAASTATKQTILSHDDPLQVPLLNAANDQELVQLDNQIEFNEALINERDAELREIEASIGQVNEIFRDLGALVHDQGHLLGNLFFNTRQYREQH